MLVAQIKPATMFEIFGIVNPEMERFLFRELQRQTRTTDSQWYVINVSGNGIVFICTKKLGTKVQMKINEFLWAFTSGASFENPTPIPIPNGWGEIEGDENILDTQHKTTAIVEHIRKTAPIDSNEVW